MHQAADEQNNAALLHDAISMVLLIYFNIFLRSGLKEKGNY